MNVLMTHRVIHRGQNGTGNRKVRAVELFNIPAISPFDVIVEFCFGFPEFFLSLLCYLLTVRALSQLFCDSCLGPDGTVFGFEKFQGEILRSPAMMTEVYITSRKRKRQLLVNGREHSLWYAHLMLGFKDLVIHPA